MRALGAGERSHRDLLSGVIDALRDRHLLLVIDNFEHLLGETPGWLSALLAAASRVKCLITSRVPLNIGGEQRFLVAPFAIPAVDALERLRENAAVGLFTQRAHAVNPAFALDATNASAVAEICRRLDGLPLGIELAAARSNLFTPDQILARLSDRLALLAGGQRDALARHRSMRAAIGWSYDLLSPAAQFAFRRFSVFAGGVSLDAFAFVIAEHDGENTNDGIDILEDLVEHNLVRPVPGLTTEPRYGMLETIREFGVECLNALGEVRSARNTHAEWFARLVAENPIAPPDRVSRERLDLLEIEHPNLRAAIAWFMDEGRIEEAVDMAIDIIGFRYVRGYVQDVGAFCEMVQDLDLDALPPATRAKVLLVQGGFDFYVGNPDLGRAKLSNAADLFAEVGNSRHECGALLVLGHVHRAVDDLDRADQAYTGALHAARRAHHVTGTCAAKGNLGIDAMLRGRLDAARAMLDDVLRVIREAGNHYLAAWASIYLGQIALQQGDRGRAAELLVASEAMLDALGNKLDQPKVLLALSELAADRGDERAALRYLEAALEAARAAGETQFVARALLDLGRLAYRRNAINVAARQLTESLTLYVQLGFHREIADCLGSLAVLAVEQNDLRRAARFFGAASGLRASGEATSRVPSQDDEQERASVAVCDALGTVACREQWDAGGRMNVATILADATGLETRVDEAYRHARLQEDSERFGLTAREVEVIRYLADGLNNQEIARELFISRRTVASHIEHIIAKLDVRSRTAVVAFAIRNDLV